jgi:ribosomal protein S6
MKLYEGMFVLPQTQVRENEKQAFELIEGLINKVGGQVKSIKVWAERSLAYEIRHVREASYVIAFFECDPEAVARLERSIIISGEILRTLIVNPHKAFSFDEYLKGGCDKGTIFEEGSQPEVVATEEAKAEEPKAEEAKVVEEEVKA